MSISAKLIFLCGKMAAGKSTLARDLAQRENAVLLVQDEFLDRLFPGEITDIPEFVKCSSRLKNALGPHVCALLSKGISVVLDFPGNTKAQRAWFRELFERANAEHELHFVDASDVLCKSQLRERSKDLPAGTPWTTDAEFEAITVHFQPPSVGVLILRVEMVVCLAVGVFVARRLLFGRSPVVGGDVFILIVTAAGFVIGLCIARGTRWGRKWAR